MGKVLFIFLLGNGHMNVCISVAKQLLAKYPEHECYFNVDEEFAQKVTNACHLFKPVLMDKVDLSDLTEDSVEKFEQSFFKVGLERYLANFDELSNIQNIFIRNQKEVEKVIDQVKPDFILIDQLFNLPYVENKGIPWGVIMSTNPLYAQNSSKFPPSMSALSSDAMKDGHLWSEYRIQQKKSDVFEKKKKWFKDCNVKLDDDDWFLKGSNYLNFYAYPTAAKYWVNPSELSGKWFTGSHAILDEKFENKFKKNSIKHPGKELLTSEFLAKPGKLILFSMGTIVSAHLKIMNLLLDIIGLLPHKFIVSCGSSFDKIKLPDNCVGASYVDQKELYPIVDCMVTHAGNNTFCELFYYHQKPFCLIPFFGDQPDNTQRVNELGLGVGIQLSELTKETLSAAIERITTDEDMKKRVKEASKLSLADKGLEKFVDELHLYLKKEKY